MREAVDRLVLQGLIQPGERVVAISGSPLAMRRRQHAPSLQDRFVR